MTTNTPPALQVPTCTQCQALPEELLADNDEIHKIPALGSPDAITSYPGWCSVSQEVTHAVDLPGLLATYDLEGDEVRCGFPDREHHLHGYMVKTRCRLTVNIGNKCAKKWISNFGRIEGYQKQQKNAAAGRDALDGLPELSAKVAALAAAVPELKEIKYNIRQDLPALHQEMFNRAQAKTGGREVLIETKRKNADGETVVDQVSLRLKGLSIWTIRAEEVEALHTLAVDLKKEIDELGELGVMDATRLSKRYSELSEAAKVLTSEIEDGRSFFADDQNLAAAIYAAGVNDVTVRDRGIEYEKNGRRYRLRSDGTRVPVTPA